MFGLSAWQIAALVFVAIVLFGAFVVKKFRKKHF